MMSNSQLCRPELTKDVVKSHLQKYRLNNVKCRAAFLSEYDASMNKALGRFSDYMQGHASNVAYPEDLATAITTVRDSPDFAGGEVASSLSLQCILDEATRSLVEADVQIDLKEYSTNPSAFLDINRPVAIPTITPEEEGSPLGSMI